MSHSPHRSLAARVLAVIERHPEALHLEEVRYRLCQDGHRPNAYAVAVALLDLQRANLTQIGGLRRWSPYRIPTPHFARSAGDRDTLESVGSARLTSGPVLTAIPATLGVPRRLSGISRYLQLINLY